MARDAVCWVAAFNTYRADTRRENFPLYFAAEKGDISATVNLESVLHPERRLHGYFIRRFQELRDGPSVTSLRVPLSYTFPTALRPYTASTDPSFFDNLNP